MADSPADDDEVDAINHWIEEAARILGLVPIDQVARLSIQTGWMGLPEERQTVDELESLIRRLLDQALRDFRDDPQEFGRRFRDGREPPS
jgi:hypothetical protein